MGWTRLAEGKSLSVLYGRKKCQPTSGCLKPVLAFPPRDLGSCLCRNRDYSLRQRVGTCRKQIGLMRTNNRIAVHERGAICEGSAAPLQEQASLQLKLHLFDIFSIHRF